MLGDRIKELRKLNKMTQQELSEKLGITPSAIGMYEQNRREPKFDVLEQLCKIFSVSPDYFLSSDSTVALASSQNFYRTNASDFDIIIDNLRQDLKEQKGLMFRGEILDDTDLEKIFDAMKIGAEVALKSKK
ncbi:MAG: helix-turn-helix transcriptional regulator [Clostridia bacterium]